jgi:uncharacterized RDD family membrane protein YckC
MLDELAPFPTFGSRVAAWLIDLAVIGVLAIGVGIGSGLIASAKDSYGDYRATAPGRITAGVILMVVFLAAAILYLPLCDGSRRGQTLGKRLVGLRVVRARDGQPLGYAHGLGRFLARVADAYSIGLLWAAADRYGRAFHDHLAATVVVDANRFPPPRARVRPASTHHPRPARDFATERDWAP